MFQLLQVENLLQRCHFQQQNSDKNDAYWESLPQRRTQFLWRLYVALALELGDNKIYLGKVVQGGGETPLLHPGMVSFPKTVVDVSSP